MKSELDTLKETLSDMGLRRSLNINDWGFSIAEREIADKFITKSKFKAFVFISFIIGFIIGFIL